MRVKPAVLREGVRGVRRVGVGGGGGGIAKVQTQAHRGVRWGRDVCRIVPKP
jgi:hypothetical protein